MKQPIPFGKYFLLERVNVGGMAEVFKAKATGVEGFERLVAVKRILPNIAEDEEFITMFIDEAKIAVQLTHANIAQIFDLGKVADSYFIALEYIRGKDLRAIFNRCRSRGEPMSIPLACYAIMKVCEGLDYAHQKRDADGELLNLVHRDVSPQNLLVSYEGEVKIIDFGIAKAAGKVGRTQAGILKGKFGYMSPEQTEGLEIDRRSDVFGLGICLYEMLTGERLFVAETDFATLEKVKKVEIMPPSTYNRRITEELEHIVFKALAKNRDERHQTAMELYDDLQSYLYQSGQVHGRKDLSSFMRKLFEEEIERENARDRAYSDISLPAARAAAAHTPETLGVVHRAPTLTAGWAGAGTGTGAMGAVETVGSQASYGVGSQVGGQANGPPGGYHDVSAHSDAYGRMGHATQPPSVPPLLPRATSIPPLSPRGASVPPVSAEAFPGLEMEWDDDELSTQIYDKPEELVDAIAQAPNQSGAYMSLPPELQAAAYGVAEGSQAGQPAPFPAAEPPAEHVEPQLAPRVSRPSLGRGASGRSTLWGAALAVAGILSVIVVALTLFRSPAEPGMIRLQTVPAAAEVALDGQPVVGTSPFMMRSVVPGTTHDLEVTAPGFEPWTSRVRLEPGQLLALPKVTLKALETGFSLDSVPSGAKLFVDNQDTGQLTPAIVHGLAPGTHAVRLELDGFAAWAIPALHVTAGEVVSLPDVVLGVDGVDEAAAEGEDAKADASGPADRPAQLPAQQAAQRREAESEEAASRHPREPVGSSADRADRGAAEHASAPERTSEPQAHGPRAMPDTPPPVPRERAQEPEVDSPGAAGLEALAALAEESAGVDPTEQATEEAAPPAPVGDGILRVNSRPWSVVFVDGREIGPTPQMRIKVPAGVHEVLLVNEDFGMREQLQVQVEPGETVTRAVNLARP